MWILAWVECAPSITSSQPFDSGSEVIQVIHVQNNKITTVSLTLSFSSLALSCSTGSQQPHPLDRWRVSRSQTTTDSNSSFFSFFQECKKNEEIITSDCTESKGEGGLLRSRMAAENGDHVVELVVHDTSPSPPPSLEAEIIPLLNPVQKPKINIFTISYPRTKTRV